MSLPKRNHVPAQMASLEIVSANSKLTIAIYEVLKDSLTAPNKQALNFNRVLLLKAEHRQ